MKDFWEGMGLAVVILAICIGPASCAYIGAKTAAINAETKAKELQLKQLEKEKKP
jgi:hypothetical protein